MLSISVRTLSNSLWIFILNVHLQKKKEEKKRKSAFMSLQSYFWHQHKDMNLDSNTHIKEWQRQEAPWALASQASQIGKLQGQ